METKELIKVWIDCQKGKTVCICKRENKKCKQECEPDVVERDVFRDWELTMNKYSTELED